MATPRAFRRSGHDFRTLIRLIRTAAVRMRAPIESRAIDSGAQPAHHRVRLRAKFACATKAHAWARHVGIDIAPLICHGWPTKLRPDGAALKEHAMLPAAKPSKSRLECNISNEFLLAAVESAGDAIVLTELDGTIMYVNPAFERINGMPREQAIGKNLRTFRGGADDLVAADGKQIWDALKRGETWRGCFCSNPHNSTFYCVEKTMAPVRDACGRSIGYVSVGRDVTEYHARERAEQLLRSTQYELDIARSIQQRLFPAESPNLDGFEIAGKCYPADSASGDYFDFVPMCNGALGLVVADVSGHGVGPALLAAETRAYLRSLSLSYCSAYEIVNRANEFLVQDTSESKYVTLHFIKLNPVEKTMVHVGAGHEGYLLNRSSRARKLPSTGVPLGVTAELKILSSDEIQLHPNDLILMTTDGLAETRSPNQSMFGSRRMLDVVRGLKSRAAMEIVEGLYAAARRFAHPRPQPDDVTIIVAKVNA